MRTPKGDTASDTDEHTLYDLISTETGVEFDPDEFENAEKYKAHICRHLFDMQEADFEKLPKRIITWYNSAARVIKANRGAKDKVLLPAMDGLEGDEAEPASSDDDVEDKKPARRGASSTGKTAKKASGTKKTAATPAAEGKRGRTSDHKNNRYGKIARAMLDKSPTLDITDEVALKAALKTGVSESTAGYGIPATRAIADALKEAGWKPPR